MLAGVSLALAQSDVGITKSGPATVTAGGNYVEYTIVVTNAGPSDAVNVSWTDTLPANTDYIGLFQFAGAEAFICSGGPTVTCSVALLSSGKTANFKILALVRSSAPAGSTISNTATVTSSTPDPDTTNNSSTSTATVVTSADVYVLKSGPSTAASNTQITYDVFVRDDGPSDAANVTLTDVVPANMTFASAAQLSGPPYDCTTPAPGGTGAITCTIASLAGGAEGALFRFVFNVPATIPRGTQATNTATVSATTPADPNPANNSASVITTVGASIPALSPLMLALLALMVSALALAALRR